MVMHSQKDSKLAPAKNATRGIRRLSRKHHQKPWPTAEIINRSQGKRLVLRTSAWTYSSNQGGKLTSDPFGRASFVNKAQPEAQRISPEDHKFYEDVINALFEDILEAGADTVTRYGDSLTALATARTAGARRSQLSTTSSPVTKRAMPHLAISCRQRQRWCYPHQLRRETDDYDNDVSAPLGSHVITGNGNIDCLDVPTGRKGETFAKCYVHMFNNLGQLACKDIAASWIKSCHPKKQTRYPYKGRSRTRPDYWPSSNHWEAGLGCRHIEPAHLKKSERIFLLLHLLCYGGQFCIEKLQESTNRILVSGLNHWTAGKLAALNAIYAVRRKEIEIENGTLNGSLVDWTVRFRAGQRSYGCDTEISPPEYILKTIKARNTQRSDEYPNPQVECPHQESRAHDSQSTVVSNAGIRPSSTLIDPEAGIKRSNSDETDKPEIFTIEGASESISTPMATEGCVSQVEMLMPSPTLYTQQQQTLVKSSRYHHRRLLMDRSSPMLPWEQSMYAEEPLFKSELVDCERQTSSALSSDVVSRLWTSDGLGPSGDDIVPYPSGINVVGDPPDMPDIEVQQHNQLLRPPVPRASGLAEPCSDLACLDAYWHTPITDLSAMGNQQYDASRYPFWDSAPETANTFFGSDFAANSRPCFSNAGFPFLYNQTRDEAIQDQYAECLFPGFSNPSVNPTYLTRACNGMSG